MFISTQLLSFVFDPQPKWTEDFPSRSLSLSLSPSLSVCLSPPKHVSLPRASVLWSHHSPPHMQTGLPGNHVWSPNSPVIQQKMQILGEGGEGLSLSVCAHMHTLYRRVGRFKTLLQICMSNMKCISIKIYLSTVQRERGIERERERVHCVFCLPASQQPSLFLYSRQNS